MFRSTRALFAKEWSQHRRAIATLSGFFLLIWLGAWLAFLQATRALSVIDIVPRLGTTALPAAALVLGHRLIIAEYYGRTQRFLEALPLRRGEEAAVKALFGGLWLLCWGLLSLDAALLLAARREPIEFQFVMFALLRLSAYTFFLWGVVFLFNVFGRLRFPLLLLVMLVLLFLNSGADFNLFQFGPLRLIEPVSFVTDRDRLPWRAVMWAVGIGGGCFATAVTLIGLREGGIVEALAKPLSNREKGALLIVVLGALTAASLADQRRSPPMPAAGSEPVLRSQAGDLLEVAYGSEPLRPAADALVKRLGPVLRILDSALPAPALRVRLVHGNDVLLDHPLLVSRHPAGVIVRVNLQAFATPGTAPDELGVQSHAVAQILHAIVIAASNGRALIEPRHFWTDGFATYLADRCCGGQGATETEALLAYRDGGGEAPSEATLARYHSFAERVGEGRAMALAGAGWRFLQSQFGEERSLSLAKALLSRRTRGDVRDYLHDRFHPPGALFATATGTSLADFVTAWRQHLDDQLRDPTHALLLGRAPQAKVVVVPQAAHAFDPVIVKGNFSSPLPPDARCQVLHKLESWFDTWASSDLLQSESLTLGADRGSFRHVVDGDYESGERVFVALECRVPGIPGRARLHATRVTVP